MQATLKRTGRSYTQSLDSTLHPEPYIEKVWPDVEPFVQRVLDRMDKDTTTEMIKADLLSQDRQLWIVRNNGEIQAVILTMITDYRGNKVGSITHAAGDDFRAWESSVDPIANFFKVMGCVTMAVIGRRGWKKYLEGRDFQEISTNFERKL